MSAPSDLTAARPIFRDIVDPQSAATATRQKLIKEIEEQLDAALISYTASIGSPGSQIMVQDAILLEDMLLSVSEKKKGVLMLTSPGGDPNAAEKLLLMFRKRFPDGFQVLVPYYAKSAATLICLGADKILMGYGAELGPIDPQLVVGGNALVPARAFIDGLEDIRRRVQGGDPATLYYPMIQQIRPELIAICQTAIADSQLTAAKWLKKYMLKSNPTQADKVAELLSKGEAYKSHGKPIDFAEASTVLQLVAEQLDFKSGLWLKIWELLSRSVVFMQQTAQAKLLETGTVSMSMAITAVRQPARPQQPPANP